MEQSRLKYCWLDGENMYLCGARKHLFPIQKHLSKAELMLVNSFKCHATENYYSHCCFEILKFRSCVLFQSSPGTCEDVSLAYTEFLLMEQKRKMTLIFLVASVLFSFVTNTIFFPYLIDGEIFLL